MQPTVRRQQDIPFPYTPPFITSFPLVEESDDLSCNVLASGLLVVHDTGRGGEDDVTELTSREELDNPFFEIWEADVVSGRDDTSLVQARMCVSMSFPNGRQLDIPAIELDYNLARAVVVDFLKLCLCEPISFDFELKVSVKYSLMPAPPQPSYSSNDINDLVEEFSKFTLNRLGSNRQGKTRRRSMSFAESRDNDAGDQDVEFEMMGIIITSPMYPAGANDQHMSRKIKRCTSEKVRERVRSSQIIYRQLKGLWS